MDRTPAMAGEHSKLSLEPRCRVCCAPRREGRRVFAQRKRYGVIGSDRNLERSRAGKTLRPCASGAELTTA